MNKIDTIEAISDQLARTSIMVTPERCVYIRNWNSKCKRCLSACQHEAIKRSIGRLKIDSEVCTNCGACVSTCPTGTMATTAPTMTEIVRQTRTLARANGGLALFTCTRHARSFDIDPEKAIVLPCLNYLDEYLITGMYAVGIKDVALVCPDCEGCDVDCGEPYFKTTVKSCSDLLELWHVPGELKVSETVPASLRLAQHSKKTTAIRSDRRDAFKQAGGSVMELLVHAVDDVVGTITGEERPEDNADRQITVRFEDRFPVDTYRSARMLKMLDHLGARPYGATIDSRLWASIDIDPTRCRHCGICANMCVTQALKYTGSMDSSSTLTFQPSLCVGCRLCRDGCLTHSMIYSTKVMADDLDGDVVKTLFDVDGEQD